uniref:Peptidase S1 domain-containing protein n=1 Tax=Lynx canadensis TaxID=61383 RepID=A0A667ILJ5_LYNCA
PCPLSLQMLWLPGLPPPSCCFPASLPENELVGIVGGHSVPQEKWPWQVSLKVYDYNWASWVHICGGSLIHPQWVLTAAHCIAGRRWPPLKDPPPWLLSYRIHAGDVYLYGGRTLLNVTRVIVHPDYINAYLGADVALLQLSHSVKYTANVRPVRLPLAPLEVTPEDECWVTGWGNIMMHGSLWSGPSVGACRPAPRYRGPRRGWCPATLGKGE